MSWSDEFLKTSLRAWPIIEKAKSEGGYTDDDLLFHIEKAIEIIEDMGIGGSFELAQVEVKMKEALGWMNQLK